MISNAAVCLIVLPILIVVFTLMDPIGALRAKRPLSLKRYRSCLLLRLYQRPCCCRGLLTQTGLVYNQSPQCRRRWWFSRPRFQL